MLEEIALRIRQKYYHGDILKDLEWCIDYIRELEGRLGALAAFHREGAEGNEGATWCEGCDRLWPCTTARILDTSGGRLGALAPGLAASPGEQDVSFEVSLPAKLNVGTKRLVVTFAAALARKLRIAEEKYGYNDGWKYADWMDECRAKLREHIEKGDPRDVAAYCAFLWYHGEKTSASNAEPGASATASTVTPKEQV